MAKSGGTGATSFVRATLRGGERYREREGYTAKLQRLSPARSGSVSFVVSYIVPADRAAS